jgi:hypothetical protein
VAGFEWMEYILIQKAPSKASSQQKLDNNHRRKVIENRNHGWICVDDKENICLVRFIAFG